MVFNLKTRNMNAVLEVEVVSHNFVMNSQCFMNSGNQFCYLLCSYDRISWNLDFHTFQKMHPQYTFFKLNFMRIAISLVKLKVLYCTYLLIKIGRSY